MTWRFVDYISKGGGNPVAEWLAGQPARIRARVNARLDEYTRLERFACPYAKPLGGGLFEFRIKVERIQHRILFCYHAGKRGSVVLLLGAVKKSRTLPARVIDKARSNKRESDANPERYEEHDFDG